MTAQFENLPAHIAIIMDGNGRWAVRQGMSRAQGHGAGALTVRAIVEESVRLGIKYLTLYSFSSENWNRPTEEIEALMRLFMKYLDSELPTLKNNGVKLRVIGELQRLSPEVRSAIESVCEETENGSNLQLILAISYGGRGEIVNATKKIAAAVARGELLAESITEQTIKESLYAADVPDPDLLIRTSGECRISNFLLWQLAYTEIVVSEKMWPDFRESDYHDCIATFSGRHRRYGLTGQQT